MIFSRQLQRTPQKRQFFPAAWTDSNERARDAVRGDRATT